MGVVTFPQMLREVRRYAEQRLENCRRHVEVRRGDLAVQGEGRTMTRCGKCGKVLVRQWKPWACVCK